MIKSAFYIISSIIFLSVSALVVRWIIMQEAEKVSAEQAQLIISNKNNYVRENESENDADKIVGNEKDKADRLLVDVDKLIDSIDKSELAE